MKTGLLTADDYRTAFRVERDRLYPLVDAFEAQSGFAVDRDRLLEAAKVLACPVKANAPNWQHGRVLYAAVSRYIVEHPNTEAFNILDVGTAKGFSALCLLWSLQDSGKAGRVTSVDVIDPLGRVQRNTIAEVDGLKTLAETLAPWPEAQSIDFRKSTGIEWLHGHGDRIHVAFIDGKHSGAVVLQEGHLLAVRQMPGDLAIFDDVHIPDVSIAVNSLYPDYRLKYLEVLPNRHYAIGVRR